MQQILKQELLLQSKTIKNWMKSNPDNFNTEESLLFVKLKRLTVKLQYGLKNSNDFIHSILFFVYNLSYLKGL
jgi:hypothetical protein